MALSLCCLTAWTGGCGAALPDDGSNNPDDGNGGVDPVDFAALAKQHDIVVTEFSPGTYDFLIVRTDGAPVDDYRFIWHFGPPANESREGPTVRFAFPVEGDYDVIVSAFAPSVGEAARTQDNVAFALELPLSVPSFGQFPPTAHAGDDEFTLPGEEYCLDGSASADVNGDAITFAWWQSSGAPVVMRPQSNPAIVCFSVPAVSKTATLVFGLRATDNDGSTEDRVTVTVLKSATEFAADAGPDLLVQGGDAVTLSGETRGNGGTGDMSYTWTQLSGPVVELDANDEAEVHFTAPAATEALQVLTFQFAVELDGRSVKDHVDITVENLMLPASVYYEDFEELTVGENPPGWVDTAPDNSLDRSENLFEVVEVAGDLAFGTRSSSVNIHTHYTGTADLSAYTVTGRMMAESPDGGLGVTFFSDYPNSDSYYRLRSAAIPGGDMFHIAPHGTTIAGDTLTDVIPEAGVWYHFRIEVYDTGTATQIKANVWPDAELEPEGWQVDCVDDTPTRMASGKVGLWSMGAGGKYWDEIGVALTEVNVGGGGGDGGGGGGGGPDLCATDADGDGVPDCNDGCPNDPNKSSSGVCGCGAPDVDNNQNGTVDCVESGPALRVGQTSLNFGTSANSLTFKVWNGGGGTLSYTLSDNASWLTLSPLSGSSTGEQDTITATVNRSGLTNTSYSAEVTVTPNVGTPLTLVVSLLIQQAPPPGPALTPMARWDTVPFQRVEAGQTLKAGVVAFSKNGIREVRFNIAGQGYSGTNPKIASSMTYNDQSDVWEYWVPIVANEFASDGPITVEATVVGNDGGTRTKSTTPGNGLEALTLYVSPRGTLPRNVSWVDGANGNDSTGAVNNSAKPFKRISRAMKALETAGKADGGEVRVRSGNYVMDGENNWNAGNANVVNEWITVASDSASGATPANTRITGIINGSLSANRLKVKGIALAAADIIKGTVSGSHLWLQDCDLTGSSGDSSYPVSSNWGGPEYFTECRISNVRRASGFSPNQKIMRNLTISSVREDCFQNVPFGVNIFVNGSDPGSAANPEHADVIQGWGDAPHNWIWYNVVAKDLHYQGIFIRSGATAQNNAFVNCMLEMRDPIRNNPGDGRGSDFAGKFDHLVLWNCTFMGTPSRNNVTLGVYESATSPPNQFLMKNVSVRGCLFTDFRSSVSAVDKNWVNNADVTFQDNHYINLSTPYHGLAPGNGKSQGDPKIQKSVSSPDLGRPLSGSPLLGRVTPPLVPADAFGEAHGSSAPVGALAQ